MPRLPAAVAAVAGGAGGRPGHASRASAVPAAALRLRQGGQAAALAEDAKEDTGGNGKGGSDADNSRPRQDSGAAGEFREGANVSRWKRSFVRQQCL